MPLPMRPARRSSPTRVDMSATREDHSQVVTMCSVAVLGTVLPCACNNERGDVHEKKPHTHNQREKAGRKNAVKKEEDKRDEDTQREKERETCCRERSRERERKGNKSARKADRERSSRSSDTEKRMKKRRLLFLCVCV